MFHFRKQHGNVTVWVILAVLVIGAAVYYFYFWDREEPVVEPLPPPMPEIELPEETEPEPPAAFEPELPEPEQPEAVESEPLPPLGESDGEVLEVATEVLGEAPVQAWLVQEGVLSKFVATVDALTGDELPQNIVPIHAPGGAFEATSDSPSQEIDPKTGLPMQEYVIDPVNYRRYTAQVEWLESVDMQALADQYRKYYPLLEQSYRELGHSDGSFEGRLIEVIDHLLATPEARGEIRLVKPEAFYVYADPELEALSAGQKALIRMGPDNAARVRAKLTELKAAIQTQRE